MNLKQIILNELKDKDWDMFTIARYIYIRLGELFIFDPLYHYGSSNLRDKILAKQIDIENVDTKKVVCKSWAYMYSALLKEVGIPSRVIGEKHMYVAIQIEGKEIIADPTSGVYADLARIKYGDETIGFIVQDGKEEEKIDKSDEIIHYKKGIYLSEAIEMLIEDFCDLKKVKKIFNISDDMSLIEITKIKFEFLCSLLNRIKSLDKGYADVIGFFHYLTERVLQMSEYLSIEESNYYKIDEMNLEIENIALFRIMFRDFEHYYLLSKKEDGYDIEEISKEQALFYDDTFCSKRKMFHI